MRSKLVSLLFTLCLVASARAGVTRIEVVSSGPFAEGKAFGDVGAYTRITGRFYGELDPMVPANKGIVDLTRAPRNARARVEYSADFDILQPADKSKGNGTLLYDVNNRGNKRVMHLYNDTQANNALDKPEHAGDGFLMRHGFTVVWSGWIPGMPKAPNLLRLEVPNAKGIEQQVWDEFLFNDGKQVTARLTFAAANTDKATARLTVRDRNEDSPSVIQSAAWEFVDGNTIRLLPEGTPFRAGALYQFSYRAKEPPVAGIRYAATRDLIAFLRYAEGSGQRQGRWAARALHGAKELPEDHPHGDLDRVLAGRAFAQHHRSDGQARRGAAAERARLSPRGHRARDHADDAEGRVHRRAEYRGRSAAGDARAPAGARLLGEAPRGGGRAARSGRTR